MTPAGKPGGKRDAWIPWAFGAGFGLFLVAAAALAVIAARSDPGLVTGAPQRIAGAYIVPTGPAPVLDLQVAGRAPLEVVLVARLRGPDGRPAAAESMSATLHRATNARDDHPVAFTPMPDGSWRAVVALPAAGTWEIGAQARSAAGIAVSSLRF